MESDLITASHKMLHVEPQKVQRKVQVHLWCQRYLLVVQCELAVREVRPKQGDNHDNTANKSPWPLLNFHRAQHFSVQIAGCWIYRPPLQHKQSSCSIHHILVDNPCQLLGFSYSRCYDLCQKIICNLNPSQQTSAASESISWMVLMCVIFENVKHTRWQSSVWVLTLHMTLCSCWTENGQLYLGSKNSASALVVKCNVCLKPQNSCCVANAMTMSSDLWPRTPKFE